MFNSILKALAPNIVIPFVVLICCTNPSQVATPDNQGHGMAQLNIAAAPNSPFKTIAKKASLTISATDMLTMTKQLTISDSGISGTITGIPAGNDRLFSVSAFDSLDTVRYKGSATADVVADGTVMVPIKVMRILGSAMINGGIVEGDSVPMYVQFYPLPIGNPFYPTLTANPLLIRQTKTSINSFTIEWDPYTQAEGYNIYLVGDNNQLDFLEKLLNPEYSKSNITQRAWLGEYTPLYVYSATYIIKPIVKGIEMQDSSRINPWLIDSSQVISSDFFDDFNSPVLGHQYMFNYYNNKHFMQDAGNNDNHQVYIDSGCLHIDINTAIGFPAMHLFLYNDLNKDMKVSMKVNVHRTNDSHAYILNFLSLLEFAYQTNSNRIGFYINRSKYSDTTIYDRWTTISIQLKRKENKITLSYDDTTFDVYFDARSIRFNKYLYTAFEGCDADTGSKAKIDYFKIEYLPN